MEQQILSLKKAHPDLLMMVECGYRFRFFGDDALQASKVLGIYAYVSINVRRASEYSSSISSEGHWSIHIRSSRNAFLPVGLPTPPLPHDPR
jgi:hypothetical protein